MKPSKAPSQIKESNGQKKSAEKTSTKERKVEIPAPRLQFDDEHRVAKAKKKSVIEQVETKNRVELFRHLPQFVHGIQLPSLEDKFFHDDTMRLHPSIYQVFLSKLGNQKRICLFFVGLWSWRYEKEFLCRWVCNI